MDYPVSMPNMKNENLHSGSFQLSKQLCPQITHSRKKKQKIKKEEQSENKEKLEKDYLM